MLPEIDSSYCCSSVAWYKNDNYIIRNNNIILNLDPKGLSYFQVNINLNIKELLQYKNIEGFIIGGYLNVDNIDNSDMLTILGFENFHFQTQNNRYVEKNEIIKTGIYPHNWISSRVWLKDPNNFSKGWFFQCEGGENFFRASKNIGNSNYISLYREENRLDQIVTNFNPCFNNENVIYDDLPEHVTGKLVAGCRSQSLKDIVVFISPITKQYLIQTNVKGTGSVTPSKGWDASSFALLEAIPSGDSTFQKWSGSKNSKKNPLVIPSVNKDYNITANFKK